MQLYIKNTGSDNGSNVCEVRLAGILLPLDVQFSVNGNKLIAESQILDGVAVYERITRKPYEIDFDFTMRSQTPVITKSNISVAGLKIPQARVNKWSFPLDETNDIFQNVWALDKVIKVENVFLNKLGIQQVIIADIQITTIRGSIDVPIKIKTKEDFYSTNSVGTTLII
jgi:hypothetical protein